MAAAMGTSRVSSTSPARPGCSRRRRCSGSALRAVSVMSSAKTNTTTLTASSTMNASSSPLVLPLLPVYRSQAITRSCGIASTSYCRRRSSLVARATPSNEQQEKAFVPLTPPSKDGDNANGNDGDDDEAPIKPGSLALLRWSLYNEAWDVPWSGKETAGTMLAWVVSFVVVGASLAPLAASALGAKNLAALSAQDKSLFLLLNQLLETAVGLAIIQTATKGKFRSSQIPRDVLRVDFRRPLSFDASAVVDRSMRRNDESSGKGDDDFGESDDGGRGGGGWLSWGLVGMAASPLVIGAAASAAAALSGLSGGATSSGRGTADAVAGLLDSSGSGSGSGIDGTTLVSLLVVTAVLAPILEETVFRGFLLPSLTKIMPVPAAVVVSAAAFATAHLSARDFPQLLAFGILLGFVHVRSRNLLSTMLMHGAWNGGVLLLLAALASSGVDLEKLLAS